MKTWIITGIAAASLLAGTAYACPDTAPASRHPAPAKKVAQHKTAGPKPDARAWAPFQSDTGKIGRRQESGRVLARYPWAAVSPFEARW